MWYLVKVERALNLLMEPDLVPPVIPTTWEMEMKMITVSSPAWAKKLVRPHLSKHLEW
jgi:hypothetical protein